MKAIITREKLEARYQHLDNMRREVSQELRRIYREKNMQHKVSQKLKILEKEILLVQVEIRLAEKNCSYGDVVQLYFRDNDQRMPMSLCIPHREDYEEIIDSSIDYNDLLSLSKRCFRVTEAGKVSKKCIIHDLYDIRVIGTYNKKTRKITYY